MNERIKELAEQAGMTNTLGCFWQSGDHDLERFADLVRQDLYQVIGKSVIEQINSAVQMEREACALLCLELVQAKSSGESYEDGTIDCAEAIRARGKHD